VFKLDNRDIKIVVYGDSDKGVYTFQEDSATGKTWLCETLKKYRGFGDLVDGYSYSDYIRGYRIKDLIGKGLKLVVLDRYDMYNGEMTDEIVELSKECLVLIDCKVIPDIPCRCWHKYIMIKDNHITIA
jgi:hypothetical protein